MRLLSKQATESAQFHITDLLDRESVEPGVNLGRVVGSVRTLDRILSERDIQDVVSAQGSYKKSQAEMELLGDYTKNPLYMLDDDEEFIIVHYRLIKRKRPELAGFAAPRNETNENANQEDPQGGGAVAGQPASISQDDKAPRTGGGGQAGHSLLPTWKSGIKVTNSIIQPIGPDGRNTDNMHWDRVAQLPLGALS